MTSRFANNQIEIYFLVSFMCISFIIIGITILIMLFYCKKHAQAKSFKTGLFYLLLTIFFCTNYCGRLYNECFGDINKDDVFVITTSTAYGTHFLLLTYLLFNRLYFIFDGTIESISRTHVILFVAVCVFASFDFVFFGFFV
eukprot:369953_1